MSMLINDMQYRVFRAESGRHKPGEGLAVPLVLYLSNVAYVFSQVFAIRRLVDPRTDVISITRLLKELTESRFLMTRENYVSYDGTPYDPRSWKSLDNPGLQFQFDIFGIDAPGLEHWLRSTTRHERFDALSGTSPTNRKRTDLIKPKILERLASWVKDSGANKYVTLSHKYFAHAAQVSSINKDLPDEIDLAEIEQIQRALIRTSKAIFDVILCSEIFSEPVPMLPLGSFGTVWLDGQFVDSTTRMQKHWDNLAENRNAWIKQVEEDLIS